MINRQALKEVGLTESEAEVYLILLNLGEATVYQIADQSKIARPNIYDTVKKLLEKGLATSISKNNKKYFKPVAPLKLLEIIKDKEKNLSDLLPELTKAYETKKAKPLIEIFEGAEGIKTIMNDMVKEKWDIWIFNGVDTKYFFKHIPEFNLKRVLNEKKRKHIKTKMLYSKNVTPIKGPGYSLKQLPGEEFGCVSYWVYGDRAVIGIWSEPMVIIRIVSEEVAKVYKKSFELVWDSIK